MAGAIGRPLLSHWPGILAPRRASAGDYAAPVAASSQERTCRGHRPAVVNAGALGAATHAEHSLTGRGARAAADGISAITRTNSSGSRRTRGRTTDTARWWAISVATTHVVGATGPATYGSNRITAQQAAPPPTAAAPSPQPAPTPPPLATMSTPLPAEAGMSAANRRQVQEALRWLDYYRGRADGVFGQRTRAAIRRFQQTIGAETTGTLTADEADLLVSIP